MTDTKGVVAIVGCGLGLGGAIATKFAKEGYTIAAMARSQESLDYVQGELAKVGPTKHGYYTMDATKKAEVDATFEKIFAELGMVWAPHKRRGPARVMEFLGLLLCNVPGMECIGLTEGREKRVISSGR